jgi:hypothetical protein
VWERKDTFFNIAARDNGEPTDLKSNAPLEINIAGITVRSN